MKTLNLVKLPVHLIEEHGYLDMEDAADVIVATINTHHNLIKDAEYMVEAINNYPKAIELLEKCFNSMSMQKSNVQEEQDLMDEITDLLNINYND